jgi:GNAT superfamily N-acetyltransferase
MRAADGTRARIRELGAVDWRAPAHVLFVAERSGRALGLVYGRLEHERPEVAYLEAMWVDPSARGRGVGRALVAAVIAWARARSARRIELQVTEGNTNAEYLYGRAGFAPTQETQPLRPGSPLRVRTLRKELTPP